MYSTVLREATPGRMLLRPPEKPAKKCGSIKPSEITRSASRTSRFSHSSPPEGSVPIKTMSSSASARCTTISSRSTMPSPNRARSSCCVVGRCIPVATRMVRRTSGLFLRTSSSNNGMVIRLGIGRV